MSFNKGLSLLEKITIRKDIASITLEISFLLCQNVVPMLQDDYNEKLSELKKIKKEYKEILKQDCKNHWDEDDGNPRNSISF